MIREAALAKHSRKSERRDQLELLQIVGCRERTVSVPEVQKISLIPLGREDLARVAQICGLYENKGFHKGVVPWMLHTSS